MFRSLFTSVFAPALVSLFGGSSIGLMATAGMTADATWTAASGSATDLSNISVASARVTLAASSSDTGIIMESGSTGTGLALYIHNGVLYFSCGWGGATGSVPSRAWITHTITDDISLIEWSASTQTDLAALYVNGTLVGTDTVTQATISGEDVGGVGQVYSSVAVNAGGWTANGSGSFTGIITRAEVFVGEATADVDAALAPASTSGLVANTTWTSTSTDYTELSFAKAASARIAVSATSSDEGIIMEAGASGSGLALYIHGGVLYFSAGFGGATGSVPSRAWITHTITEDISLVEWSASTTTDRAALYVNGRLVGTDGVTQADLVGGDEGGLGEVHAFVAVNEGGWTADGSGVFTGTIAQAEIYLNQVTRHVTNPTVVFTLGGQSNGTPYAEFDGGTDFPAVVDQWSRSAAGRTNNPDQVIVPAARPLDHHSSQYDGGMGWALQFCIDYVADNPNTNVLLIPCARGGAGFVNNFWNPGDSLHVDLIARTNAVMTALSTATFGGILWHQGEADFENTQAGYAALLDAALTAFRTGITVADSTTPIVLGQLDDTKVAATRAAIADTPNRLGYTAVVDTTGLATQDGTHFTAASYRTMGTRYNQQLAVAAANAA